MSATEPTYREAINALEHAVATLDKAIGRAWGLRSGQYAAYRVVRARDELRAVQLALAHYEARE